MGREFSPFIEGAATRVMNPTASSSTLTEMDPMFLTSWASSLLRLRRHRTRQGNRRPILLSAELLEERVVLTTSVPAATCTN